MATTPAYREHRLTRTKIIATVGPACGNRDMLRELVLAGADIFRLNFAHGTHEWLSGIVGLIRDVSHELNRPVGILGDLSGPKIRLGILPDAGIVCHLDAEFVFIRGREPNAENELTCTYDSLVDDLQAGNRVLLADGIVTMKCVETNPAAGFARCVVDGAGTIRSRQGVNLPGVKLSTPSLTEKDRSDLGWAIENGIDFVGYSFVRSADDIRLLRSTIAGHHPKHRPLIVAKIEKEEAVADLEAIIKETDCVMVARGDLGVEMDIFKVPGIQKRIIRLCRQHRVPVITATQMLDSMQRSELPTRAEASDVANAVLDGTDAVMLSGETAAGLFPRESVAMMSRIVREAELLLPELPVVDDSARSDVQALEITEAVAVGAVATARKLSADLIAVATVGGRSVMAVSKERSTVPVLAICSTPEIARRMTLLWGVTPLNTELADLPADNLAIVASEWGRQEGVLSTGGTVVVMASSRWSAGGHDAMLVHIVE